MQAVGNQFRQGQGRLVRQGSGIKNYKLTTLGFGIDNQHEQPAIIFGYPPAHKHRIACQKAAWGKAVELARMCVRIEFRDRL